jgi:hypothetical protein
MNVDYVLLHLYVLIGLHPRASIWGGIMSERKMFPIHRLAIGGFLTGNLITYSSGWVF